MCGIAGIWQREGCAVSRDALDRFADSLAHRGPDGRGTFFDDAAGFGLGHRRLAILDPTQSGRQPMTYADGRYVISFNGEVFNFLEVREQLEGLGHTFVSDSDTEVVLAAYAQWGEECQLRFNGMWAFGIWDRQGRELFLSRDRFGIKPLHYAALDRGGFAFASELKAFKALEGFEARLCEQGMRMTLTDPFSLEGTSQSLLAGVSKLPAGHCATLRERGDVAVRRWWCTVDHLVEPPSSLRGQADAMCELLFDSCRLRMRSDVPIGTALSGGLDSSSVLCTMARIGNRAAEARTSGSWHNAFVATFPETPLDESEHAAKVLRHAGVEGRFLEAEVTPPPERLERALHAFEGVYICLPTSQWDLYGRMREAGVCVSLDGHGVDEMLGGYPGHGLSAFAEAMRPIDPIRALDVYRTYHAIFDPGGQSQPASLPTLLARELRQRRGWSRLVRAFAPPTQPPRALRWAREHVVPEDRCSESEHLWLQDAGELNRHLYRDFHHTTLPTILRNFDRVSMAHGVEIRMPFMDWRIVTLAFSLPASAKIGGGFTKRVLREATRGVLPEAIRTRRIKVGFAAPMVDLYRGPMRHQLEDLTRDRAFLESPFWRGPEIADAVRRHLGSDRWSWEEALDVWRFQHAHWFIQNFVPN